MIPPASAPPVYYSQQQPSQAQPLSSPDPRAFSNLGLKPDRTGGLDAANPSDAMATRSASLVAPPRSREEPEQDQIHSEASKSGTSTKSETAVESKKPEVHVIRKRNVGVPKFLRFLFQILEVEDEDIISWSHQGTAFQIRQPEELADKILPKYFKHNKVSSFQRQLNYFGFKKWTKTQTNICTFSHPFFLQADKDMMKLIKRKERVNTTGFPTIAAVPSLIEAHCQAQAQLKAEAAAFAQLQSQLPQQQAIKRQKSNTMAPMVSGQTAAFLNSAMAGRRHSTGMLPGSEAYGLAAAAAAAAAAASASAAETRKKEGTPAELELGLDSKSPILTKNNQISRSNLGTILTFYWKARHSTMYKVPRSYLPDHGVIRVMLSKVPRRRDL
ncbi:hypothetical protein PHYBOEH_010678 [Phytophthora boehmeriae]|uniref:HSF-type DNA-binding domain-containing protein n=1 Tax=Phytophthora boehmeriae TaxID=109152 RepID=A0A8T1VRD2_9STRA|nr:hypothetical protein PHYBOEH_010678 [Phytophthora boehmeriae]